MPDWNPVEIIEKHPSPLSISLYKYLITDNNWSKARTIRDIETSKEINLCK